MFLKLKFAVLCKKNTAKYRRQNNSEFKLGLFLVHYKAVSYTAMLLTHSISWICLLGKSSCLHHI